MDPYLYNPRGDDSQNEVEPNVSKDTPKRSDEKNTQVFNFATFSSWDYPYTNSNDHKHIEGCTAHYGARPQFSCIKVVDAHLTNR